MSDTLAPFPTLPPPPSDPGEYLSHFGGDLKDFKIDKRTGALILVVTVDLTDKYLAMPLTDIRGRRFSWTVHTPRGKKPLVARGALAVYAGREGRAQRAKDRRWGRVKAESFTGSDDV